MDKKSVITIPDYPFSFNGILNIGIVATREVRELAKLALYIEDEFSRLEQAVNAPG